MRAVVCREWGTPEDLTIDDLPEPDLTEGGVRIAVRACGVNFADTLMITGEYQTRPPVPYSPGLEVSGDVLEVARGISHVKPGDRVMAMTSWGGYAEQVMAPGEAVYKVPDGMDYISAAAFPVVYGTSHIGLKEKLDLKAGEVLLVLGAAGGVGLTAVELGKKMGATVIATAGGQDKLAVAKKYGADHLIDHNEEDIRARVKQFTDGRGADCVYDPVGGSAFDASLRAIVQRGRILIVGFASGTIPQVPANILLVKNISLIGYFWGAHRKLDPELIQSSFDELLNWYAAGELKPHVSHTFDLSETANAMRVLKSRKSTGKVVLTTETRYPKDPSM